MKKSKKVIKINNSSINRLRFTGLVIFIILVLLIVRLAFLQFVEGSSLKAQASAQQTSTKTIEPNRGVIYDSKGKVLAVSVEVDKVSVNPSRLEYTDRKSVPLEVVAQSFSNIFDLEYSDVLEKLNTESQSVTIASNVEHDKIELLKDWMDSNNIRSGITIESSTRRYYPYNNLACHMLGFTRY